jgi:TolB protein
VLDPAWSKDGQKIAYVRITKNEERIYVMNPDGGQPPRKNDSDIDVAHLKTGKITTLITGGVNTFPDFSPDMKHIVFRRMLGEMNSEVFIADADGTNARYQILIMTPDVSDVRLVANTEGRATVPRWSPDGNTLYFTNCVAKDYGTDCEILVSKLPN